MSSTGSADALARKIRTRRLQLGLTQNQLAEIAGLSTNAISSIECGKRFPRPKTLDLIAQALRVGPDDLMRSESPSTGSLLHELTEFMRNESDDTIRLVLQLAKAVVRGA